MLCVLKTFLVFLWRRDSMSAACVCVAVSAYLNAEDTEDMCNFFETCRKIIS